MRIPPTPTLEWLRKYKGIHHHLDVLYQMLEPKDAALPGIVIELKAEKGDSVEELTALEQAARRQTEKQKTDAEMKVRGIEKVLKYGVALSGKTVEIAVG